MIYCGDCGAQNPDGKRFCWKCGKPIGAGLELAGPIPATRPLQPTQAPSGGCLKGWPGKISVSLWVIATWAVAISQTAFRLRALPSYETSQAGGIFLYYFVLVAATEAVVVLLPSYLLFRLIHWFAYQVFSPQRAEAAGCAIAVGLPIALIAVVAVLALLGPSVVTSYITNPAAPTPRAGNEDTGPIPAAAYIPPTIAPQPTIAPSGTSEPPRATQTSTWLLAEDFADNTNGWTTDDKMFLENGAFHLKETDEGYSRWSSCLRCGPFTDFAYEALLSKLEGPDNFPYGITFRSSSAGRYVFGLTGNGGWIFQSYTSQWNNLTSWSESDAVVQGNGMNKVRVVARGSAFEFYVNDKFLGSAVDTTLASGYVGFVVEKAGQHISAEYLRVSNPEPVFVPPATPSPQLALTPTRVPTDIQIQGLSQDEERMIKDGIQLLKGCAPSMYNYVRTHVDTVTRGSNVPDTNAYVNGGAPVVYLPADGSINDPNHYTDSMRTFVAAIVLVHEARHLEMGTGSTEPDAYRYTLPLFGNDKCVPNDIGALTVIPGGDIDIGDGTVFHDEPRDSFPKSYCSFYVLRKYTEWRAGLPYPKEPPSYAMPPGVPWECQH